MSVYNKFPIVIVFSVLLFNDLYAVEFKSCSSFRNRINNMDDSRVWTNPNKNIFGKQMYELTGSDIDKAIRYAQECLKKKEGSSIYDVYEKSTDEVIETLNNAKEWTKEAKSKHNESAVKKEQKRFAKEQKIAAGKQKFEEAVLFFKESLPEVKSLPNTKDSLKRLDEIEQKSRELSIHVKFKDGYELLDIDLDNAISLKRTQIKGGELRSKCSENLLASGLPKEIYGKKIIGVYRGAIQYQSNFEALFCNTILKGYKVTYLPPKNNTNYGMRLINEAVNTSIVFGQLPDSDYWVIKKVTENGFNKKFMDIDALMLLRTLSAN